MASFLYCSPFYSYCDSWESDNYRKGNKGKTQRNYTKIEAKKNKNDSFTRGNREKSNIGKN